AATRVRSKSKYFGRAHFSPGGASAHSRRAIRTRTVGWPSEPRRAGPSPRRDRIAFCAGALASDDSDCVRGRRAGQPIALKAAVEVHFVKDRKYFPPGPKGADN